MAQSFLSNLKETIILDASAVINLIASEFASEIIETIPNLFQVPEPVLSELNEGRSRGWAHADDLNILYEKKLIEIKELGGQEQKIFESLIIGGGKDTLDDGEAATIACAHVNKSIAIIDERKAIRIVNEHFNSVNIASSVDLFCHPLILKNFSIDTNIEVVYNALTNANMRVLPHHEEWVINLIGTERAAQCCSLPQRVRSNL